MRFQKDLNEINKWNIYFVCIVKHDPCTYRNTSVGIIKVGILKIIIFPSPYHFRIKKEKYYKFHDEHDFAFYNLQRKKIPSKTLMLHMDYIADEVIYLQPRKT